MFTVNDLRRAEDIVRKLVEFGLGVHFGSINVVPLHLSRYVSCCAFVSGLGVAFGYKRSA